MLFLDTLIGTCKLMSFVEQDKKYITFYLILIHFNSNRKFGYPQFYETNQKLICNI